MVCLAGHDYLTWSMQRYEGWETRLPMIVGAQKVMIYSSPVTSLSAALLSDQCAFRPHETLNPRLAAQSKCQKQESGFSVGPTPSASHCMQIPRLGPPRLCAALRGNEYMHVRHLDSWRSPGRRDLKLGADLSTGQSAPCRAVDTFTSTCSDTAWTATTLHGCVDRADRLS
jgi:hypothetical protein